MKTFRLLLLLGLLLTLSSCFVGRMLIWNKPKPDDFKHFPAREIKMGSSAFHFVEKSGANPVFREIPMAVNPTHLASLEDILIVCDDLSLSFGELRLRPSGSAGGHNGLKSIIKDLGSNQVARLRLGIDAPKGAADAVDYVLTDFTPAQKKALPDFINHALDCVTCWVTEGAAVSMNRFNVNQGREK